MLKGLDILLPRCLHGLFTLAPFSTARGQAQPKCHSTGKEKVKMQYIDTVTTVKKNEICHQWMGPETIRLHDVTQIQKTDNTFPSSGSSSDLLVNV